MDREKGRMFKNAPRALRALEAGRAHEGRGTRPLEWQCSTPYEEDRELRFVEVRSAGPALLPCSRDAEYSYRNVLILMGISNVRGQTATRIIQQQQQQQLQHQHQHHCAYKLPWYVEYVYTTAVCMPSACNTSFCSINIVWRQRAAGKTRAVVR